MTATTTSVAGDVASSDATVSSLRRAMSMLSFSNASLVYVWAAVFVVFSLWIPDTFLTAVTWKSLAAEQAVTVILALAVVISLSAGVFDLSLAAVLGAAAVLVAHLMAVKSIDPRVATLITLLFGVAVGGVTASMVVGFRVHSFIAGLGMASILSAITAGISNNQLIIGVPNNFQKWVTFDLLELRGAFWIAMALAILIWFVLEQRPIGRQIRATGSNTEAARLAGVPTDRITVGVIVVSAVVATLAGLVVTGRVGTGSPSIGPPYLLPAFAAAFLGSTQIKRGRFNVVGTVLTVYTLATGVKGLQLAGAPFWLPELFNGTALLLAVALSVRSRRLIVKATRSKSGNN